MSFTSTASPDVSIKIGDEDYILSPFGMKQWAEYCLWLQYQSYKEAVSLGFPNEKCEQIYEECKKEPITPDHPKVAESFQTFDGVARLIFTSLQVNYPKLTEAFVNKNLKLEEISKTLDIFYAVMGLVPEDKDKKTEGSGKN